MRRIVIVGSSAAGKSTLARALATRLNLPHLELDSVYHQAGWTTLPTPEFRARVDEFVRSDRWVIDGNYTSRVGDLLFRRADTVLWLRLPRRVVLRQVLQRTTARVLLRRQLWNGNRERLRAVWSRDPERSIVVWAWTMHDKYDDSYTALRAEAADDQHWLELRTRQDVRRFLADIRQS